MIVLDCETEAIVGNPIANPPAFCGLAYDVPGYPPGYLHFRGEKSNARWNDVAQFIHQCWDSGEPLLFHNAPFDLAVICREFLIPLPKWDRIHDTVYLTYLADPYAQSLSLKPSADRYLGLPPEEQDELTDWLVSHGVCKRKDAGKHIVDAPLELISKYAIGDVVRTRQLYEHLIDKVPKEAYDRERHVMPTLYDASKRGLRVARPALEACLERSYDALEAADNMVRATLQAPGLDPSDGSALIYALEKSGMVSEDDWVRTETGRKSVAKGNLERMIPDKNLVALLKYRSSLSTCISTFMLNWLEQSREDGRLHPEWNQVRTNEDGKRYGTRTGRISCSNPNLTNVPNEFSQEIPKGLPPLPFMRQFLLPEEGHVWLKRDFNGQELRIAAHFEDGPLLRAYEQNPALDPHQMTKERILEMLGKDFDRKHVKITGFQIIYGGGGPAISLNVGCSIDEAKEFKSAYFTAMPGIRDLSIATTRRGRSGEPIKTWGGRLYYREISRKYPSRDFSYKLLNYLIQGSAADQTKQVICDWADTKYPGAVFLTQVYDELNISAPIDEWEDHMQHLKETMEAPRLDCPMLTEGFVGENWHEIEDCF